LLPPRRTGGDPAFTGVGGNGSRKLAQRSDHRYYLDLDHPVRVRERPDLNERRGGCFPAEEFLADSGISFESHEPLTNR
jgi:hypothetical protein